VIKFQSMYQILTRIMTSELKDRNGGGKMQAVFGFMTPTVAVIVLVIALIIFGPGKLPQLGKALGGGIKEFREASGEGERNERDDTSETKKDAS
jgi:sec-independent protein translocase protein TatA